MISLEGKIYGIKETTAMYAAAPGAFYKVIRHRLYSERKRYIGSKKSPEGKFRKQLLRKRHAGQGIFGRAGNWPRNLALATKGYLSGEQSLATLKMTMGFGLRHPTDFTRGIAMMDAAYTGSRAITARGKQMPIPVYRNIAKVFTGPISAAFRTLSRAGKLQPVTKGNKTFWFYKDGTYSKKGQRGQFKRTALLFVGARSITIKPQFDFRNMFTRDTPAIINRAQNEIDSTVRRLNMGLTRKSDFVVAPKSGQ